MRPLWVVAAFALSVLAAAQPREDPRAISIHPFVVQRGTTFNTTLRGSGLAGATAVSLGCAPFAVTVEGVGPEPAGESSGRRAKIDLVKLRVEVRPDAKAGRYPVRLIARNGVSNALPIEVVDAAVIAEPAGPHDRREAAIAIPSLPATYAGRLARRGETDYYSFQADAGQVVTFQVVSGLPQIAAGGSAATVPNFDPAISIYESAGRWFY